GNILPYLDQFKEKGFEADILVVDPPRKGLDQNLIRYLQKGLIKKIIYVSCNPSTLVKNLNHLNKVYKIESVDTIDLMPLSSHIEVITSLTRK
ncbi:MAG: 23S rRNA (uracil-5-)-methyltransferase RumA, partial [Bacilli bacterium]|nr:23S rRNA (uracil-5-)-methyltransferase RumA [Bacilli bacterium]